MLLASGDSNGQSAEGVAGRVLLILTEVITLLVWAFFVAACTIGCCWNDGNHLSVHLILCCVIKPPNIYCSVTFELCPQRSLLAVQYSHTLTNKRCKVLAMGLQDQGPCTRFICFLAQYMQPSLLLRWPLLQNDSMSSVGSRVRACTGIVELFKHLLCETAYPQFLVLKLQVLAWDSTVNKTKIVK